MNIRGLEQSAHLMVMSAEQKNNTWILKGNEDTFDELLTDLYDEVEYKMQPAPKLRKILEVICEISPGGDF
jgi:hypothetical protein